MSAALKQGGLVLLAAILGGGWLYCALRHRKSPASSGLAPSVTVPGGATPASLKVHVLHGSAKPSETEILRSSTPLAKGFVVHAPTPEALSPETALAFFQVPREGMLVLAGDWRWNESAGLHYLEIGDGTHGLALGNPGQRQVTLWADPSGGEPSRLRTAEIHPQFSEELRAVVFTGAAFRNREQTQRLIDFFGDHVSLLGWSSSVLPQVREQVLAHKSEGFLAKLTLNRVEHGGAPSIALQWLLSAAAAAPPESAVHARAIGFANSLGPVERGLRRRPASDALEVTTLNSYRPR